jgi:hypothetical protein
VPEREVGFEEVLNEYGDMLRVRFVRDGKEIIRFSVQYEVFDGDEWHPAIRHDTGHGFAHRDVLDWDGETVRWSRDSDLTYREAMNRAIDHIKTNWVSERESFLRRRR